MNQSAYASSDHGPGLTKLEVAAIQLMVIYLSKGMEESLAAQRAIISAKELFRQLENKHHKEE